MSHLRQLAELGQVLKEQLDLLAGPKQGLCDVGMHGSDHLHLVLQLLMDKAQLCPCAGVQWQGADLLQAVLHEEMYRH